MIYNQTILDLFSKELKVVIGYIDFNNNIDDEKIFIYGPSDSYTLEMNIKTYNDFVNKNYIPYLKKIEFIKQLNSI